MWLVGLPRVLQAPFAFGAKIGALIWSRFGGLSDAMCSAGMVTNNCIVESLILVGNFVVLTLDLFLPTYTGQMTGDLNKVTSGLKARYGSLGWGYPEHPRFIHGHNEQRASEWLFPQLHSAPCLPAALSWPGCWGFFSILTLCCICVQVSSRVCLYCVHAKSGKEAALSFSQPLKLLLDEFRCGILGPSLKEL